MVRSSARDSGHSCRFDFRARRVCGLSMSGGRYDYGRLFMTDVATAYFIFSGGGIHLCLDVVDWCSSLGESAT